MPRRPDRQHIGGYLTPQSHQWWHNTARHHRVTVSALLEAIAQQNLTITQPVADTAANIDDQRRNRKHRYPHKTKP